MDKTRIIVVEDNIVYCEFVCNLLAREGFRTVQAYHLSTAKKLLQQASDGDIVVSDLRLPDGDGIDLLRWMRKEGMTQPLIIMTNYAEVHTAVESMKLGSLDYIPKQLVEDKLMPLLHTILKERSIGRNRMPVFARDSSAFQKIMQQIRLVAPTDMSVLIWKGVLACAVRHDVSFIVMASRGLGSIGSFLLGSETQKVLHQVDRPVLIVR